ncbi:MAG: hypothetical protein JWQ71_4901 [Pedosphaera sp.]|nr:hypothetical protein [Pedosphaera sp.]
MNAACAQTGSSGDKKRFWWWAVLGLAVCAVAISNQSLWIDEALTAGKAGQASLAGWWGMMKGDMGSDLQMPLYMIYVWGFAKVFGASEWALRAANIPWFVTGLVAFIGAFPKERRIAAAVVAACCPFAWYYLNEARPYAMQIGASLMIFGAIYRLSQKENETGSCERFWVVIFFLGIISLCGSSMLGVIWAGAACLSLPMVFGWKRVGELARRHLLICLISLGLLLVLGGYYVWTLKVGARASEVGRTDLKNVGFVGYELLGFGGLGPGRLVIRDGGIGAFLPFAKEMVLFSVVVLDLVVLAGWSLFHRVPRKTLVGLIAVTGMPIVVLFGAGYAMHFRVLGRHFTPLLTVVLFVLAIGLSARWKRSHWASKPMVIGFLGLSLASCFLLRLAERHQKDDYRAAAAFANTALNAGQVVWWNAGKEGAAYYRLPIADGREEKGRAVWLVNPAPEILGSLQMPEIIISSKPDVYDNGGVLGEYISQGKYFKLGSFAAFTIWQRKSDVL